MSEQLVPRSGKGAAGGTRPPALSSRSRRYQPAYLIPESKRRAAKALFDQGAGYKFTASLLGLNVYTVRDWARKHRHGQFSTRIPRSLLRYPASTKQTVLQLRALGMSWREIAAATSINASTCRSWVFAASPDDLRQAEAFAAKQKRSGNS